jgi:hypothetical protein
MNRIAAIALLAIATSMTAGNASAQSAVLKVDVPFSFSVSDTFLPAGSYALGFDPAHPNVLLIEDRTRSVRARAFVERGLIGRGALHTLTFHRYGGQYFLSEIHLNSALEGVLLPETKLERQAGGANRTEEVASISGR